MRGWLHKRGDVNPAFKARFCVLAGKELRYHEDERAAAVKGVIDLHGSTCEVVEASTAGRHRFHLMTVTQGDTGRTFILEAADTESRDQWVAALMLASVAAARPAAPFPDGVCLDQIVGPCPVERTWRQEWTAMRMEQLRATGATERANRRECLAGGSESIEQWSSVRSASIEWKVTNGWDREAALAYSLCVRSGCRSPSEPGAPSAGALKAASQRSHESISAVALCSSVPAAHAARPALACAG